MECSMCGSKINPSDRICNICGSPINQMNTNSNMNNNLNNMNGINNNMNNNMNSNLNTQQNNYSTRAICYDFICPHCGVKIPENQLYQFIHRPQPLQNNSMNDRFNNMNGTNNNIYGGF